MRCQPACRRLRSVVCAGFGAGVASAARRFADPRLLAAQQAADVGVVAENDQHGDQLRQLHLLRLARQPVREPAGALRLQQRPEGDRRAANSTAIHTDPAASATDRLKTNRTPSAIATPLPRKRFERGGMAADCARRAGPQASGTPAQHGFARGSQRRLVRPSQQLYKKRRAISGATA